MPQAFSNKLLKKLFFSLFFVFPVLLAYRNIIFNLPQTWGDAPYFSEEYLKEISFTPPLWDERNTPLGGINQFVFIHPIIYLTSLTHNLLNISSPLLVNLFFYLPSVLFSFVGAFLIAQKFTKNRYYASLLAGLFYSTNTYILMVIDGGQAGIAAAYGLSAITIYFGLNLYRKNLNYFFATLTSLLITSVYDPRIALITLLLLFLYYLDNLKIYLKLIFICLVLIIFSAYWLYPLIIYSSGISSQNIDSSLKLIYAFSLYHPNWPDNVYGVAKSMPLYYPVFSALLLGLSLYFKKYTKLVFIFLIFVFLSQSQLLTTVDVTGAFRDTTKFYLPLMLIASILIAHVYSNLINIFFRAFIYMFVLILIYPALLGKLNFVLSGRSNLNISNYSEENWARTLYIPERYPLNYHSSLHPSLDGNYLFNLRPFAVNNAGTFDQFNYLNNIEASYLYELLGVKDIIFTNNARQINPSEKDIESLEAVKQALSSQQRLENVTDNGVLVYKTQSPKPKSWKVEKAVLVFGEESSEYYKNILPVIHNALFLYPQDKYYLHKEIYENKNILVYSEDFEINDLVMSMVDRSYFVDLNHEKMQNNWANYGTQQFNEYQYQLLIRGVAFRGFDYGQGVSFSDQLNEKIVVNNLNSNNRLFIRYYCGSGQINLNLNCTDKSGFKWFELDSKNSLEIETLSGLNIVNTLVSIPSGVYKHNLQKAKDFINNNNIRNNSAELADEIKNSNGDNFIILNHSYYKGYPAYGFLEAFEREKYISKETFVSQDLERSFFNLIYILGMSVLIISILSWGIYFIYTKRHEN